MSNDDNNSELEERRIDAQRRALMRAEAESGGGRIEMKDPRVSAIGAWISNIIQGLVVLVLAWVANNLYQVNLTLAADAVTKQQMLAAIADHKDLIQDHERRLETLSGRVYVLEGKTMRGVPDGKR